MKSPVTYVPAFIPNPQAAFDSLWNGLAWERRGLTPRREYYSNDVEVPYTYGQGVYAREYLAQPWHPVMREIQALVEHQSACKFEVCFLNGYDDEKMSLGWHADDSVTMDDNRPIALVSLGSEREIWFRPQDDKLAVERLLLQNGSLCLMMPGMQDSHYHRIPKAGFACGPRISLTFRGFAR